MNETIGAKGGRNDRKRRLLITKKVKEKLKEYQQEQKEKELLELEKKVKLQQKITFFKTLPIVTIGQVYTVLTEDKEKEKELVLKEAIERIEHENAFSEKETEEIIEALKQERIFALEDELLEKLGINRETYNQVSDIDLTEFTELTTNEIKYKTEILTEETATITSDKQVISKETKEALIKAINLKEEKQEEKSQPVEEEQKEIEQLEEIDSTSIKEHEKNKRKPIGYNDLIEQKIERLKNHKIVDEYEKKLKEIRTDLRKLVFEYNMVVDASNELYDPKEADKLLERLNEIIKKIEELKNRISLPDIDKYDDNYLYTLVEEYIQEFKNKQFVDEIKDSPLYVMISEKIDELDNKKDDLQTKIEDRKTKLELDEEKLEQMKERYYNYESFNKTLLNFQLQQDAILNDIREKMATATTIQERVETQVVGIQRQARRLMPLLAMQMARPGARSARLLATMTATYLYFMRNAMRPRTVTRRYKTIKVEDYHKEIEKSIDQLDDINTLLQKTSRQIDITIKEFEKEFKEYLDVIPECRNLLSDLEHIKDEIKEKEYELNKIKYEQENNLEKNDAKVKVLTTEESM